MRQTSATAATNAIPSSRGGEGRELPQRDVERPARGRTPREPSGRVGGEDSGAEPARAQSACQDLLASAKIG